MKCTGCGVNKLEADFYFRTDLGKMDSRCKNCIRSENREYNESRRKTHREKLNALKLEKGCVDCGYRMNPVALQFDHMDRSKKRFILGHSLLYSWDTILEEVAKCEIRCANCHAIKTIANNDNRRISLLA